jgi:hypothetical protein
MAQKLDWAEAAVLAGLLRPASADALLTDFANAGRDGG